MVPIQHRVFLIGFMCAGKSTVGRALALLLDLPFIDIDREVEKRVGPLLPFIQKNGEEAFRKLESEVLGELLNGVDAVIATGGGTPCEVDNLLRMKEAGTVVLLQPSFDRLMDRIERSGGDRPLLFGLTGEVLRERVRSLLEARWPYYEKAHWIIHADDPPDRLAKGIATLLQDQRK